MSDFNEVENKQEKSGIELLKEYFSKLPKSDLFKMDKYFNPIVNISWFFTEDLSREIVIETVARLLKESNSRYESEAAARGKSPKDISDVIIKTYDDQLSFIFKGADRWSKLQVVGDDVDRSNTKIPTLSFTQFQDEISKTIISMDEPDIKPFRKGIGQNIDSACKNLIDYYSYCLDYRDSIPESTCFVDDVDYPTNTTRPRNPNNPVVPYVRLNDIIPPSRRFTTLESLSPMHKIIIHQKGADGSIQKGAYHVYIYHGNILEKIPNANEDGYLFICEPYSGNRQTRFFYESIDAFQNRRDGMDADSITKVFHSFVKENLEKTTESFRENGVVLSHTTQETYDALIKFYITGQPGGPSANYKKQYSSYLKELYGKDIQIPGYKPRLITIADLSTIALSGGFIDRTAEQEMQENENVKEDFNIISQ